MTVFNDVPRSLYPRIAILCVLFAFVPRAINACDVVSCNKRVSTFVTRWWRAAISISQRCHNIVGADDFTELNSLVKRAILRNNFYRNEKRKIIARAETHALHFDIDVGILILTANSTYILSLLIFIRKYGVPQEKISRLWKCVIQADLRKDWYMTDSKYR